jgi:hypothetical protein
MHRRILIFAVAIALISGSLALWRTQATAQPSSPQGGPSRRIVSSDDLSRGQLVVHGPLGQPLGKILTIEARLVHSRAKGRENLLEVLAVEGVRLPSPVTMDYGPWSPRDEVEIRDRKIYRLRALQAGGFHGLPEGLGREGVTIPASRGYGFKTSLTVLRDVTDAQVSDIAQGSTEDSPPLPQAVPQRNMQAKSLLTTDAINTRYSLIGPLGVPLGKVVRIEAVIRSNPGKGYRDWLEVNRVNGKPLDPPVLMKYRPAPTSSLPRFEEETVLRLLACQEGELSGPPLLTEDVASEPVFETTLVVAENPKDQPSTQRFSPQLPGTGVPRALQRRSSQ